MTMPSVLHLDAVLTPTRSLPRRGLYVLLAGLAVVNILVGILFTVMGAKPVPFFLGIDFIAVVLAFKINNARAGQSERVQVSADEILVLHEIGQVRRMIWRSPTAFTRLLVEAKDEPEARVSLWLSGKSVVLGAQLSPQERVDFAESLDQAIRSARAERHS